MSARATASRVSQGRTETSVPHRGSAALDHCVWAHLRQAYHNKRQEDVCGTALKPCGDREVVRFGPIVLASLRVSRFRRGLRILGESTRCIILLPRPLTPGGYVHGAGSN